MNEAPHKARILIALGMNETAIVLATDSAWVSHEVGDIGNDCEDIGILEVGDYKLTIGVYLWEGVLTEAASGPQYEPFMAYKGTLRTFDAAELHYLLNMAPPNECPLCGEPLGNEKEVHSACADREAMHADLDPRGPDHK